jgi:peroxiredoxin
VKRKGWSLPVLLDLDGDVAKAYLANAIPETVVIGKDGVVKKVFVGSGNEDGIKAAVEAELKR